MMPLNYCRRRFDQLRQPLATNRPGMPMTPEELRAELIDIQLMHDNDQFSYTKMLRYLGHLQGFARAARLHLDEPLAQAFEQARKELLRVVVRHDLHHHDRN